MSLNVKTRRIDENCPFSIYWEQIDATFMKLMLYKTIRLSIPRVNWTFLRRIFLVARIQSLIELLGDPSIRTIGAIYYSKKTTDARFILNQCERASAVTKASMIGAKVISINGRAAPASRRRYYDDLRKRCFSEMYLL